jgi:hypothetical protein
VKVIDSFIWCKHCRLEDVGVSSTWAKDVTSTQRHVSLQRTLYLMTNSLRLKPVLR